MTDSETRARKVRVPKGLANLRPGDSFDPGRTTILELLARHGTEADRDPSESSVTVRLSDLAGPLATSPAGPSSLGEESPYFLIQVVGEGGFGVVWEAVQQSLGRRIAIKRLRDQLFHSSAGNEYIVHHLVSSFRQEVLTTGCLEHPNIVPVYDLGADEEGRPLMAMKYVRGRHWDEVMAEDAALPMPEYLARQIPILIQVSQAVAFAHSRGVVHRDIKPSQVMIGEFGEVLLMDWGLALVFDPGRAELQGPLLALSEFTPWSPSVTSPAGTPSYMAPEQTEEAAVDVGPWTDVYLLGGCLYFMLTGYAPHEDQNSEASFRRAVKALIDPPEIRAPDRKIPAELSKLCMRALDPDRRKRPSAKDFIAELQDYLTGAGKRREAGDMVREAGRIAERSWSEYGAGYENLARCTQLLDRALVLAPDSMEAEELRQHVLLQFARIAIENNDLKLAQFQAERLNNSPERDAILEEIEQLSQKQNRVRRSLEELYRRAASEYDGLDQTRAEAEEVVALTLTHMCRTLQLTGQVGLLSAVARRALKYFEKNPEKKPTKEHVRVRFAALRAIGEVLEASGKPELAVSAYRQAFELLQGFLSRRPADPAALQVLGDLRAKMESLADADVRRPELESVNEEIEAVKGDIMQHLDRMLEE